jgi:hypothetical protein
MSWSREEALTDPAISEPMKFLSEFRFSLGDIPVEITIRLYQPVHSGRIVFRRSHDIVVSGINPPAPMECEDDCGEGEVLRVAVNDLIAVYNAARAKGLKPDRAWLEPNPGF